MVTNNDVVMNSNFSERLNQLLRVKNLSQIQLCDITQLKPSSVSLYVNGLRIPKHNTISIIADSFNLNPAWLMGYDVPMHHTLSDEYVKTLSEDILDQRRNKIRVLVDIVELLDERGIDTVIDAAKTQESILSKEESIK